MGEVLPKGVAAYNCCRLTMESRPELRLVLDEPATEPGSRAKATRLGLSWVEKTAAASFVGDSPDELAGFLELVRSCAESLAGDDASGARRRLVAREIAVAKSALDVLTAAVGERLKANDTKGASLADKLATSAAKRLAVLVELHRADTAVVERAAVVAIGRVGQLTFEGER